MTSNFGPSTGVKIALQEATALSRAVDYGVDGGKAQGPGIEIARTFFPSTRPKSSESARFAPSPVPIIRQPPPPPRAAP